MEDETTQNNRAKIQQISGCGAYGKGDLAEYDLSIGVVWADVEHICISVGMGSYIDKGGYEGTYEKHRQNIPKVPSVFACKTGLGAVKTDEY